MRHLATRALRGARAAAGARPHACPVQTWAAPPRRRPSGPSALPPGSKKPPGVFPEKKTQTAAPSTKWRPTFLERGGLSGVPLDTTPIPAPDNHMCHSVAPGPLLCGPQGLALFHRPRLCCPC